VNAGAAADMTDADSFEAFVRMYQDMVFATAVRLLGNQPDAEDIAQTVFLRAYQRFGEIGASPTAGGWLKTVTRNACLNYLSRYRARHRFFSEMEMPDAAGSAHDRRERLVAQDGTAPEARRKTPNGRSKSNARFGACPISSACRWSCFISKD
jgi:RNA polymerase sigma factor (sigma-70 family)